MMTGGKLVDTLVGIGVAIIGVALLATILSKNAQTPQVISAAGGAMTAILTNAFAGI